MSCDYCKNLIKTLTFSSSDELNQIIKKLGTAVIIKKLEYVGTSISNIPSATAVQYGYQSDIVAYYFCYHICGQPLLLHAETYHGSGGSLDLIGNTPPKADLLANDTYEPVPLTLSSYIFFILVNCIILLLIGSIIYGLFFAKPFI